MYMHTGLSVVITEVCSFLCCLLLCIQLKEARKKRLQILQQLLTSDEG